MTDETLLSHLTGSFAEALGNSDDAMQAYEHALRHNPQSIQAMMGLSVILKKREEFGKSAEYLQAVLKIDQSNGEAWGSLGHCFLMMDDLQQAYAAYQSALMNLRDVKVRSSSPSPFPRFAGLESNELANVGAEALVWHWYPVRQIWVARTRRGSILPGHAHAARLREGQRGLLPTWNNIQAAAKVWTESGGKENRATLGTNLESLTMFSLDSASSTLFSPRRTR